MNTFEIMTYVMSAVAIVILGVIFTLALKRYLKCKKEDKLQIDINDEEILIIDPNVEVEETVDEYDIKTTYIINSLTGKLISMTKSNGEFYHFDNDEKGRLIYYKNHLGVEYHCKYDDEDRIIYKDDCTTGKKYSIEYDEKSRICHMKDENTGLEEWYTYNEDTDRVYLTMNSLGQSTYNINNMPKDIEIDINNNLEGYKLSYSF